MFYAIRTQSHWITAYLQAQARDDMLAKVCEVIKLPLLQVPAKQTYAIDELRSQFLAAINPADKSAADTQAPVEKRRVSSRTS